MELKIKQIENGYLMEWQEETEENKFTTCQEAIVNDDDMSDDDKESMKKLLYYVAEFFGCHYNKWSQLNLKINWDKKGHKLE